ncbi:MAG TPA: serine hydrolase domain-containing protein [Candidatus Eisenbacteria bacterium]
MGLWGGELTLGREIRGELRITRRGAVGHATIAGVETTFAVPRDSICFDLPRGLGRFRGVVSSAARTVDGFWIQPAPAVAGSRGVGPIDQAYASPLVLDRLRASKIDALDAIDEWRGDVRPLENRFTLYLRIWRDPSGALVGAFRNPEMNSIGGASQFRVVQNGDSLWFSAGPDPARPARRLGAVVERATGRIRVDWPDLGRTLALARLAPSSAASFFPRLPPDTAYVYRPPPATGDGWATGRARDAGLDEAALTRLVQDLVRTDPSSRRPALIHSILVARHGKLVLDEYFFGFDRDRPHDLRSAGKTFASAMLGAAMLRGARIGPDSSVYAVLAGRGPFANPDPRKARITLAHLMTHTSGLACDDNDDDSPGNEDRMQSQGAQPDWWRYTLDLPLVHEPGTRYAYASGGMNLVGAAVTAATGAWLPEWFARTVARPLQFGRWYWNLMPTGEGYLGGGAYVRPRDLLKLGQAFLDGGAWNGSRIVDSSWVARSTTARVEITPATTGLDSASFRNAYVPGADGLAWHLHTLAAGARAVREYEATGNGGQLLIVVPGLDLAVVITAGNYGQGGIWIPWRDTIVAGEILAAIRD